MSMYLQPHHGSDVSLTSSAAHSTYSVTSTSPQSKNRKKHKWKSVRSRAVEIGAIEIGNIVESRSEGLTNSNKRLNLQFTNVDERDEIPHKHIVVAIDSVRGTLKTVMISSFGSLETHDDFRVKHGIDNAERFIKWVCPLVDEERPGPTFYTPNFKIEYRKDSEVLPFAHWAYLARFFTVSEYAGDFVPARQRVFNRFTRLSNIRIAEESVRALVRLVEQREKEIRHEELNGKPGDLNELYPSLPATESGSATPEAASSLLRRSTSMGSQAWSEVAGPPSTHKRSTDRRLSGISQAWIPGPISPGHTFTSTVLGSGTSAGKIVEEPGEIIAEQDTGLAHQPSSRGSHRGGRASYAHMARTGSHTPITPTESRRSDHASTRGHRDSQGKNTRDQTQTDDGNTRGFENSTRARGGKRKSKRKTWVSYEEWKK
ncbi:uncharacterized protein FOMMEDRAFT_159006 [Fomitiporia mediterranea MF3/22]|uniref:uncharacterized protein n=1 Tax=Fomitiporia mediterranea (strain MF3/22) TaxID=694068 RepID=UPI000440833F|nr:uncharacterized protein FOMMEDRAFT_159006 [Fomitiporia mediterranea MF3/22]EJD00333.1 hypothetical protein FOMMEDRAFT_159006 [Fomitiporia mediterranea MF3/22]